MAKIKLPPMNEDTWFKMWQILCPSKPYKSYKQWKKEQNLNYDMVGVNE